MRATLHELRRGLAAIHRQPGYATVARRSRRQRHQRTGVTPARAAPQDRATLPFAPASLVRQPPAAPGRNVG